MPDHAPWDIAVGAPNWWRSPAGHLAFISDATGFVVDPVARAIRHEVPGVIRIEEDPWHGLLLLLGHTDLTAIGVDGIRWRSEGLARGDLKVRRIDDRGIHVTGFLTPSDVWRGIPAQFVVDPRSGVLDRVE